MGVDAMTVSTSTCCRTAIRPNCLLPGSARLGTGCCRRRPRAARLRLLRRKPRASSGTARGTAGGRPEEAEQEQEAGEEAGQEVRRLPGLRLCHQAGGRRQQQRQQHRRKCWRQVCGSSCGTGPPCPTLAGRVAGLCQPQPSTRGAAPERQRAGWHAAHPPAPCPPPHPPADPPSAGPRPEQGGQVPHPDHPQRLPGEQDQRDPLLGGWAGPPGGLVGGGLGGFRAAASPRNPSAAAPVAAAAAALLLPACSSTCSEVAAATAPSTVSSQRSQPAVCPVPVPLPLIMTTGQVPAEEGAVPGCGRGQRGHVRPRALRQHPGALGALWSPGVPRAAPGARDRAAVGWSCLPAACCPVALRAGRGCAFASPAPAPPTTPASPNLQPPPSGPSLTPTHHRCLSTSWCPC